MHEDIISLKNRIFFLSGFRSHELTEIRALVIEHSEKFMEKWLALQELRAERDKKNHGGTESMEKRKETFKLIDNVIGMLNEKIEQKKSCCKTCGHPLDDDCFCADCI